MAANVGRWWKYAQAKLNSVVSSSHAELDRLEADQAARTADKPWLASDGEAPTLEETRARIEWEAEEQRRQAEARAAADVEAADSPEDALAPASASAPPDPEVVQARIELDRQARQSTERLEQIRKELGVDPPG
ncbi:MAG TPA: hypothetical protein VNQ33_04020 [Acidimicrobiales bacterium]|nr:hypothetical protein [Acidimicrobiales bacterium]